ncbi:MAG: lysoplasmalogenase [Firmicutes bacterium]|nr:lysoplasmalogenase [Bacillota bacterium]
MFSYSDSNRQGGTQAALMKKMEAVNIWLFAAAILVSVVYNVYRGVVFKGCTSGCFVLLGLINLFFCCRLGVRDKRYPVLMVIGLMFSLVGDVVLYFDFAMGAAFFAIAHVFYVIALASLRRFEKNDFLWIGGLAVFCIAVIMLLPILVFEPSFMEIVCLVYAVVLSCMLGKAIGNFRAEKNRLTITIVIGSIMFFISDLMLLLWTFGGEIPVLDQICVLTYFPGQCVLARAISEYARDFSKIN